MAFICKDKQSKPEPNPFSINDSIQHFSLFSFLPSAYNKNNTQQEANTQYLLILLLFIKKICSNIFLQENIFIAAV